MNPPRKPSLPALPQSQHSEISAALRQRLAEISRSDKFRVHVPSNNANTSSNGSNSESVISTPMSLGVNSRKFPERSRAALPGRNVGSKSSPQLRSTDSLPPAQSIIPANGPPRRPTRRPLPPAVANRLAEREKQLPSPPQQHHNLPDTPMAEVIDMVKVKKSTPSVLLKSKKPIGNDDTIPREALRDMADQKERMRALEETKARLVGQPATDAAEHSQPESVNSTTSDKEKLPDVVDSPQILPLTRAPLSRQKSSYSIRHDSDHSESRAQELENQLNSVKAACRKSFELKLQKIENDNALKIRQLEQQNQKLKQQASQEHADVHQKTALETKVKELEKQLKNSSDRKQEMEKLRRAYEDEIRDLEVELSGTSKEAEELRAKIAAMEKEIKFKNKALDEAHLNNTQMEGLRVEIKDLKTKLKSAQAEMEKKNESLLSMESHIQDLEVQLKEEAKKYDEVESMLHNSEAQVDQLSKEIDDLKHRDNDEKLLLNEKCAQMEKELIATKDELNSIHGDLKDKSRMLQEIKKQLNGITIDELMQCLDEIQAENENLKHEVEVTSSSKTTLENEKLALQKQVEELAAASESRSRQVAEFETLSGEKESQNQLLEELRKTLQTVTEEKNEMTMKFESARASWENERQDLTRTIQDLEKTKNISKSGDEWEEEKQELIATIEGLEKYADEMNEAFSELEKDYEQLQNEKGERGLDSSAQYISNDAELMEFIETMTRKVDTYRQEVENLRADKEHLLEETQHLRDKYDADVNSLTESSSKGEQTEAEIEELKMHLRNREEVLAKDLDAAIHREESIQHEYNSLLKEFDRISANMCDFDNEKQRLNKTIGELREQINDLQKQLHEELANHVGCTHGSSEAPTVQNMRREFRKVLEEVRQNFNEALEAEMKERSEAEKVLRAMKREREMEAYSKITHATQTIPSITESQSVLL